MKDELVEIRYLLAENIWENLCSGDLQRNYPLLPLIFQTMRKDKSIFTLYVKQIDLVIKHDIYKLNIIKSGAALPGNCIFQNSYSPPILYFLKWKK